jgi:hypothetical protein
MQTTLATVDGHPAEVLAPVPRHHDVVLLPHPLTTEGRTVHQALHVRPGASLADIARQVGADLDDGAWTITIQGREVPRELWARTRPVSGTLVQVRRRPGKDVARAVALIALAYVSFYAPWAPWAGMGGFGGFALKAGVYMAGSWIVNKVLPPASANTAYQETAAPVYSLSGARNQARPYQPLSLIMGEVRCAPDLAAQPYTWFEDDQQYQLMRLHAGIGCDHVANLQVGDGDIADYDEVQIAYHGLPGMTSTAPTLWANVDTVAGGDLVNESPDTTTVQGQALLLGNLLQDSGAEFPEGASRLVLGISMYIHGGRESYPYTGYMPTARTIDVQRRRLPDGEWEPFTGNSSTSGFRISGNTTQRQGRGMTASVTAGRWAARLRVRPEMFGGQAFMGGPVRLDGTVVTPGAWVTRVTSPNTFRVAIDLQASLYRLDSSGRPRDAFVYLEGERRLKDAASWEPLWGDVDGLWIANASTTALRKTFTLDLPAPGQYEIRIRKVTPDTTDTSASNTVTWSALKSYQLDDVTAFNFNRQVSIRIRASGQLSGSLDQVTWMAVAEAIPVWTGSAWVTEHTSNPGAHILRFARGYFDQDGRLQAGLGYSDDEIDIDALKAFMVHCAARGYRFDLSSNSTTAMTRMELLEAIAAAGLGSISEHTGKLGVVWLYRDKPRECVVNMANIVQGSFQATRDTTAAADEIEVAYRDRDADWATRSLRILAPGVTTPRETARLSPLGCTTEAHAAREGRMRMGQNMLQRLTVTWDMDLEFLTFARYSVIAFSHDVTAWGAGGRLRAAQMTAAGVLLTLDAELTAPATGSAYIGLRIPGERGYRVMAVGTWAGAVHQVTVPAWPADVPLPGNTPGNPAHDTLWIGDWTATPGRRLIVTGIEPAAGLSTATITAVEEPDEWWDYVESGAYTPPVTLLQRQALAASDLVVLRAQGAVAVGVTTTLNVAWSAVGPYDHAQVWAGIVDTTGGADVTALTLAGTTRALSLSGLEAVGGQTLRVRVVPFDTLGRPGAAVETTLTVTLATATSARAAATNLLVNSDQTAVVNWARGYTPNGGTFSVPALSELDGWSGAEWRLAAGVTHSVSVRQTAPLSSATDVGTDHSGRLVACDLYFAVSGSATGGLAVVGGQRICGSVYMAGDSCAAQVWLSFWDAAGTIIGTALGNIADLPSSGAQRLAQFARRHVFGVAPSGAATVGIVVRKYTHAAGVAESRIYLAAPMIEVATDDQAAPSAYIAGPIPGATGATGAAGAAGASVPWLRATGGNMNAYNAGHGRSVGVHTQAGEYRHVARGHVLSLVDPATHQEVWWGAYDTYRDEGAPTGQEDRARGQLAAQLASVQAGVVVVLYTWDASGCDAAMRAALVPFGGRADAPQWGADRITHVFVGQRGLQAGQAYEYVSASATAAGYGDLQVYYSSTGIVASGAQGAAGIQGPQGPQGQQGIAGPQGAAGATSYFHIAYASSGDGAAGFNFAAGIYIGTYVDFTAGSSSNPAAYAWRQFVGSQGPAGVQGIPGANGANGQTSYLHVKYSNDGGSSFTSNGGEDVGSWIGTYVDYTSADSSSPAAYTWARLVAPSYRQEADPASGVTVPEGSTWTVPSTGKSYVRQGGAWVAYVGDGSVGTGQLQSESATMVRTATQLGPVAITGSGSTAARLAPVQFSVDVASLVTVTMTAVVESEVNTYTDRIARVYNGYESVLDVISGSVTALDALANEIVASHLAVGEAYTTSVTTTRTFAVTPGVYTAAGIVERYMTTTNQTSVRLSVSAKQCLTKVEVIKR